MGTHVLQRRIQISHQGHWEASRRHVRLDENFKNLNSGCLTQYCPLSKYYYLEPFGALYHLEHCQLIIFRNKCPLSIAEAFQLLVRSQFELKLYQVFRKLNLSGYLCLKPNKEVSSAKQSGIANKQDNKVPDCSRIASTDLTTTTTTNLESTCEPSESKSCLADQGSGGDDISCKLDNPIDCDKHYAIDFDVYKRGTRGTRSKRKNPDFQLVVVDDIKDKMPPSLAQLELLMGPGAVTGIGTSGGVSEVKAQNSSGDSGKRVVFALVDNDNSICFAELKPAQWEAR